MGGAVQMSCHIPKVVRGGRRTRLMTRLPVCPTETTDDVAEKLEELSVKDNKADGDKEEAETKEETKAEEKN